MQYMYVLLYSIPGSIFTFLYCQGPNVSEFEGHFTLNAVCNGPFCAPSGENCEHAVAKGDMPLAEFTLNEGKLQTANGMFLGKWVISSPHPHKALYYFSGWYVFACACACELCWMLTIVQQSTLLNSKFFLFKLMSVAQSCSYIQERKSER